MKKRKVALVALCAGVLWSAAYFGYCGMSNDESSDLLLSNVEALTEPEGLYYKRTTLPCPPPIEYKKYTICEKGGNDKDCLPSDC